eukprot:GHVQ01027944.1.p1 GENE.GHVQ01027944.1~~GHVQ01027944.1.p1  ORF type:complete len:665 (-),score=82.93 GHVQ01027944.1:1939-3933(-)
MAGSRDTVGQLMVWPAAYTATSKSWQSATKHHYPGFVWVPSPVEHKPPDRVPSTPVRYALHKPNRQYVSAPVTAEFPPFAVVEEDGGLGMNQQENVPRGERIAVYPWDCEEFSEDEVTDEAPDLSTLDRLQYITQPTNTISSSPYIPLSPPPIPSKQQHNRASGTACRETRGTTTFDVSTSLPHPHSSTRPLTSEGFSLKTPCLGDPTQQNKRKPNAASAFPERQYETARDAGTCPPEVSTRYPSSATAMAALRDAMATVTNTKTQTGSVQPSLLQSPQRAPHATDTRLRQLPSVAGTGEPAVMASSRQQGSAAVGEERRSSGITSHKQLSQSILKHKYNQRNGNKQRPEQAKNNENLSGSKQTTGINNVRTSRNNGGRTGGGHGEQSRVRFVKDGGTNGQVSRGAPRTSTRRCDSNRQESSALRSSKSTLAWNARRMCTKDKETGTTQTSVSEGSKIKPFARNPPWQHDSDTVKKSHDDSQCFWVGLNDHGKKPSQTTRHRHARAVGSGASSSRATADAVVSCAGTTTAGAKTSRGIRTTTRTGGGFSYKQLSPKLLKPTRDSTSMTPVEVARNKGTQTILHAINVDSREMTTVREQEVSWFKQEPLEDVPRQQPLEEFDPRSTSHAETERYHICHGASNSPDGAGQLKRQPYGTLYNPKSHQ